MIIVKIGETNEFFYYGKYTDNFEEKISIKDDKLTMRNINKYLSDTCDDDKVIPCYKQTPNQCETLEEFDYDKEDEYKGYTYSADSKYVFKYQIDKSSESNLVILDLIGNFQKIDKLDPLIIYLLNYYVSLLLFELSELESCTFKFIDNKSFNLHIIAFNDNIERYFSGVINITKEHPKESNFNLLKQFAYSYLDNVNQTDLLSYTKALHKKFSNGGAQEMNIDIQREMINGITFDDFKGIQTSIFNSIENLNLKVAGNVNKELIGKLFDILKKFEVKEPTLTMEEESSQQQEGPILVNYYQKSPLFYASDNTVMISYLIEDRHIKYSKIFQKCFFIFSFFQLRFNHSNAYSPKVYIEGNNLIFLEQGKYKNILEMENDINTVINRVLDKELICPNYKDIIESLQLVDNGQKEKTPYNLMDKFINKKELSSKSIDETYPNTWEEFLDETKSMFINPKKRIGILNARSDLLDEEYNKLISGLKDSHKYPLNEELELVYTDNITYFKK